jgi:uncharacterized metal-binding protein
MPVAFACRGCEREESAQRIAAQLDRRGLLEASIAGENAVKARCRYPVYAIEGCEKACASQWLASLGVRRYRTVILRPGDTTLDLPA